MKGGISATTDHPAKLGLRPQSLRADKGYGSGKFLAWLINRGIQPHIAIIDRRHQTKGHFTQEHFRYEPTENVYYCPEGKPLRYIGPARASQGNIYRSTKTQCRDCPQKKRCTSSTCRKVLVAGTSRSERSCAHWWLRPRTSVRTAHAIKSKLCLQRMRLERVRLRRLWNVAERFQLAATAQNIKRLVRFLIQRSPIRQPKMC